MMYIEPSQADMENALAEARKCGYLTCYGEGAWRDIESAWIKEREPTDTPAVVLFLWQKMGDLYVDPVRPFNPSVIKSLWPLFSKAAKRNKCLSFACDKLEISIRVKRDEAIILAKQVAMVLRNVTPVYDPKPDRRTQVIFPHTDLNPPTES